MDVWYLLDDLGRLGPFEESELIGSLSTRSDWREVFVKSEEKKPWVRVTEIPQLVAGIERCRGEVDPIYLEPNVLPDRVITPAIDFSPTQQPAARRWVKWGAVIGFLSGVLGFIGKTSGSRLDHSNLAYEVGTIFGAACVGAIVALLAGVMADLMSRPKKTVAVDGEGGAQRAIGYNFVASHWRGQFPLWVSYWIINFVVNIAAVILAAVVAKTFSDAAGYDPVFVFGSIGSFWLGYLIIIIWQVVGLWRSANNHINRRARFGLRAPWAGAAKIAAILMVFNLFGTFLKSALPQMTEATRVAFFGDPDIPAYSFRIMRDGTEVEIIGGFKYGLTNDFAKLLLASRQIRVVHLDSLGGRIGEAKKLNALIYERGLVTYVSSQCASVCTIAFAGGRKRYIGKRAKLGFHAPAFPGMSSEDLKGAVAEQSEILVRAGFSYAFVTRALNTPSSDIWVPSLDDLLKSGAVTGVSDGTQFAISGFGDVTKEKMSTEFSKALPVLDALKKRFPARYDIVANALYRSYLAGNTEAEMIKVGRSALMPIIGSLKQYAADDVLLELARLTGEELSSIGQDSAEKCYKFAMGSDLRGDESVPLPSRLLEKEQNIYEKIVLTAEKRAPPSSVEIKSIQERLRKLLVYEGVNEDGLRLLGDGAISSLKYKDYCDASIKLFRAVTRLSTQEAGLFMRNIFAEK